MKQLFIFFLFFCCLSFKTDKHIGKKEVLQIVSEYLTDYEHWEEFKGALKQYGYTLRDFPLVQPK